MSAIDPERARLWMHDVGKQVVRTARNVGPGPLPPVLLRMLVSDLYALDGATSPERASVRLARISDGLDHPRLAEARAALAAIDALEARVRVGDATAIARAIELARSVEEALRALLEELES